MISHLISLFINNRSWCFFPWDRIHTVTQTFYTKVIKKRTIQTFHTNMINDGAHYFIGCKIVWCYWLDLISSIDISSSGTFPGLPRHRRKMHFLPLIVTFAQQVFPTDYKWLIFFAATIENFYLYRLLHRPTRTTWGLCEEGTIETV